MKIWLTVITLFALLIPARPVQAQFPARGQIAFIGRDGNLYLASPDGTGKTALTGDARNEMNAENTPAGRRYYSSIAWSPDGSKLLFYRHDEIYSTSENRLLSEQQLILYDAVTQTSREIVTDAPSFVWKADSSGIFYPEPYDYTQGAFDRDRGIWQLDLASGQAARVIPPQNNLPLLAPGVSPDGRYLTFEEAIGMEGRGHFGLHDFQTGTTQIWNGEQDGIVLGAYQWISDSSFLVFDYNGYTPQPGNRIWKSDPTFRQVTPISPEIPATWFYGPSLSPSGDRLVAYAAKENDASTYLWVMNLDGSNARELLKSEMGPYTISWSPMGDHLVVTTGQYRQEFVQVIDPDSGEVTVIAEGSAAAWNPVLPQPPEVPTEFFATPEVTTTPTALATAGSPGVAQVGPTETLSPDATLPPGETPATPVVPRFAFFAPLTVLLCVVVVVLLGLVAYLLTRARKS